MSSGVRTVAIVLLLAVAVYLLPQAGVSGDVLLQVLSLLIGVVIVLVILRLYREQGDRLEILGDRHRGLLYGGVGLLVVAMAGRPDLVGGGLGLVLWLLAMGAVVAMFWAVYQRWQTTRY